MSTDNRYKLNDCEDNTGWTGNDTANAIATAGSFIEGAGALATQLSNADEQMSTVEDTTATGTFSVDMSDMTVYMNIKDNLFGAFSTGGVQFVIGDAVDLIGYDVGGNDAVGMPGQLFFNAYKLDVSVQVASPTTNTEFAGTEGALDQTVITQIGYGTIHLAKAVGAVDNVIMDGFYYIANDSYALTINGGVAATPETMTDLVVDDAAGGWNLVTNPLGSQFVFFAPTEWGNVSTVAEHAFAADGEQWFWVGDNSGGLAVGDTHFPFRLVSNVTDTGSWIVSNTVIVNTGTRAQFLMDDANFDTIEMDRCSLTGLGTIGLPSAGGTSRFTTNNSFNDCEQITHNGADLSGSKVLLSAVVAGDGAVFYNETADPDGEMDNMEFSQGAAAHSAIEFGTAVTANITLRGIDFTGFGSTDDVNGAVFKFLATSGSLNLNLVGCTTDGTFSVDDSAGIAVTVVVDPVTTLIHVDDNTGADLQNARVLVRSAGAPRPHDFTVTIARSGTVATVTHASHGYVIGDKAELKGITDKTEDNVVQTVVTVPTAGTYTYTTTDSGSTSYTGTILETAVFIDGLTDINGDITDSRTFPSNQIIDGFVRKASASPRFKPFDLAGNTINSTAGVTINVRMNLDE